MELKIDTYNHRFDKQDVENRQQFFVTGFFFSFHPFSPCGAGAANAVWRAVLHLCRSTKEENFNENLF